MRAVLPRPRLSQGSSGLAAAAAFAGLAAGTPALSMPHPAPQSRASSRDVVALNTKCEHCHEDISREWRASLHKTAWEDPVFASAYALEPLAFCRSCHAPEADPAAPPTPAERAIGVGCVTCHLENDQIVGRRAVPETPDHHGVVGVAELGGADACAACHEFGFPLRPSSPMQRTLAEHAASPRAGETCQSCHMKSVTDPATGKAHRSHDFRVTGDPAMLRSAVVASAKRLSGQAITVTLSAGQVGHAFPTGDLFRRLEVRARAAGEGGIAITGQPVVLSRRLSVLQTPLGIDRVQTADLRVPASGTPVTTVVLFGADVSRAAVRWEVAYQRMPPALASTFGLDPSDDETIVATGTLLP